MAHRICVHLGLPKTATTTLQQALFSKHSQIEFLGKRAGREADQALRRCSSEASFRLANQLFWEDDRAVDPAASRRIWTEELLPAVRAGRVPLYSFEGLAVTALDVRQAIANNLRDTFEDCRVMIGIRRPVDLVEALYFQRLKRRHIGNQARAFKRPRSPSAGPWLESVVSGDELASHLDYAQTIRIFVDALGRDHVGVFVLEDLKENRARFAAQLCRFLGVDETEGVRLLADPRHNIRLTQAVADRMRRREAPGVISAIYARSGRAIRKRILRVEQSDDSPSAHLSISPAVREAIQERTREGNRWLAREFDLRLSEHDYPV
jgi:hypothetical protein